MTDTVRHIAAGAAENIPLITVTNLARTLEELKKMGVWLVGTTDDAEKYLYYIDLNCPVAIVMGAEGKGLRRLTRENCDFLARLPMSGTVECLNVSVAAGICLFEVVRQRHFRQV
jgi:23S rRNA (guanosine2251-2'-O)-methyltransferase